MQNARQLLPLFWHRSTKRDNDFRAAEDVGAKRIIKDVQRGLSRAPMSVRLTPHVNVLSVIDWRKPMGIPARKQFIPLGSTSQENQPKLRLDSLSERDDSPVRGLVH